MGDPLSRGCNGPCAGTRPLPVRLRFRRKRRGEGQRDVGGVRTLGWHARSLRRACPPKTTPVEDSGRATRSPALTSESPPRAGLCLTALANRGRALLWSETAISENFFSLALKRIDRQATPRQPQVYVYVESARIPRASARVIARLPLVRHPPRRTTRTEREADLRSSRFPRAVRAGIGRRRSGAPGADLVIRRSLPRNFRENEDFSAQFAAICCHRQPPGRETRRLPHDHRPYTRPKRIHHDAVRG
jgi:hypothetical protein